MASADIPATNPLDPATAAVLRMSLVKGHRAIDRLLDLMATPPSEGADAFAHLVEDGWPADLPPARSLVDTSPGVPQLIRIKDSGKRRATVGDVDAARMHGTARYMLAVAAAMAHHGACITSMDRKELHPVLLDFAEVAGAPWSSLFAAAARRCASVESDPRNSEARHG